MRGLALLLAGPVLVAQAAPGAPEYRPELRLWRLEISPDPGGWTTGGRMELRLRLVDPRDPDPSFGREEAVPDWEGDEGDGDGEAADAPAPGPEQLRQARLAREAAQKRHAWRERRLLLWFNGELRELQVQVGRVCTTEVVCRSGENRLELLEPDSGVRLARSWWTPAASARLRITRVGEAGGGSLEVLEPGGELAVQGRRTAGGGLMDRDSGYTHASPQPGTYTLRWSGGWRGSPPHAVVVEAVLDGGTDRERRWRFEQLVLPGAGTVTLGTLDVED